MPPEETEGLMVIVGRTREAELLLEVDGLLELHEVVLLLEVDWLLVVEKLNIAPTCVCISVYVCIDMSLNMYVCLCVPLCSCTLTLPPAFFDLLAGGFSPAVLAGCLALFGVDVLATVDVCSSSLPVHNKSFSHRCIEARSPIKE